MKLSLGPVLGVLGALVVLVGGCASAPSSTPSPDDERTEETSAAASARELYETWSAVARERGLVLHREGRVAVVGVRGTSLDGTRHAVKSVRAYDDKLVVLRPDRTALELAASTHPFETRGEGGVPDVDGDGEKDVGMIDPGVYVAVGRGPQRIVGGHPAYDVKLASNGSGRLPGIRDTNHDGVFDAAERDASRARKDGLTAVLFHHGENGAPPAVGCQVLADAPMRELVRAVGGASATFDDVLVD